jgi:hypothetical protein
MKFKEFLIKAWAWVVKAVSDLYTFVYTEGGMIVSFFKTPDKSKFSAKRLAGLALVLNGLWFTHSIKGWLDVVVSGGQIIAGVVLLIVAAHTKS